jgi:hypothetical protein
VGVADLEFNRKARSVLVRHWIDLGYISIRSVNGRITVRGNLKRVFGRQEELTPTHVSNIFAEIKRAIGVKSVTPALENWTFSNGTWQQVGGKSGKEAAQRSSGSALDGTSGRYAIADK